MIFFIKQTLTTANGSKEKNILLGGQFQIGDQLLNVHSLTLVKDKEIRDIVETVHDFKICKLPDYDVPVITIDNIFSGSDNLHTYLHVTTQYKQLIQIYNRNGELDKALLANDMGYFKECIAEAKKLADVKLKPALGDSTAFFVEAVFGFYRYSKFTTLQSLEGVSNSKIDPDCFVETLDYINSFKKTIIFGDNKTLKQNVYNDEFFINIPSYYTLINEDTLEIADLIPNLAEEVCKPYTEKEAYTPNYKKVKNTPLKLIEGQNKNNGMQVYKYNERYYNSLLSWVQENIKSYYKESENAGSFLDQNGKVKDSAIIDAYSQEYLTELCKRLYSLHWSHNSSVPCAISLEQEDENAMSKAESKYEFYGNAEDQNNFMNALIILEEYLKIASTKCGYKIYVDAVIQLSRWGLDKPTAIVFEGYNKIFILGTNEIKDKAIDLSECIIKQHNGYDSYLSSLIYLDEKDIDKSSMDKKLFTLPKYSKYSQDVFSIPIGITVSSDYEYKGSSTNEDVEKVITSNTFYSMIDFVREVTKNPGFCDKIYGVDFREGTIFIETEPQDKITVKQILKQLHSNSISAYNPFYRSEDLINTYMDIGAKIDGEIPNSILTILNSHFTSPNLSTDIITIQFNTREELIEKRSNFVIIGSTQNAIDVSVLKEVLPVFMEVNHLINGKDINLKNISNLYKDVMDKEFRSEVDFYKPIMHTKTNNGKKEDATNNMEKPVSEKDSVKNSENAINTMDVFGKATSNVVGSENPVSEKSYKSDKISLDSEKSVTENSLSEKTDMQKESAEKTINSEICVYKDIPTSGKREFSFAVIPPDHVAGVLIISRKSNATNELIFSSVKSFEKVYPGLCKKIKSGKPFKNVIFSILKQYPFLNNLDNWNSRLYFADKDSYKEFMENVMYYFNNKLK